MAEHRLERKMRSTRTRNTALVDKIAVLLSTTSHGFIGLKLAWLERWVEVMCDLGIVILHFG